MIPVTDQPPQLPVENIIERLKEDASGIDGFRGAPEEFEYLIHCLEEKKMTDFMMKKLENKVLGLQEELERERQLHEKTIAYLETTKPSCLQSMLAEKTRLRAALHDSFMENLKSENQRLQESLQNANASRIQKVEAPVREILGFKTILENFLAAQTPAQISEQLETLTISESQKNQQISDQQFVENITQEELKKKMENLKAELKKKKADGLIRQFDLECLKKKHLEVVEQLATKVVQLELALEKSPVVNANQTRKELSREEKRALKIHLEVLERKHQEFLDTVGKELKEMEGADTGLVQTNKNLLEIIKKAKQQIYELKENSDIARMESNKSLQKSTAEIQKLKKEINKLEAENSSEIFRHENLIDELHKTHSKELGTCQEKRLEEFTELTNQLKALLQENTQLKTEVHDQKITLRTLERENAEIEELFCKMQDERWRKENDYEAQLIEKNEEIAELEMMAETGECSWSTLGLFDDGLQQVD